LNPWKKAIPFDDVRDLPPQIAYRTPLTLASAQIIFLSEARSKSSWPMCAAKINKTSSLPDFVGYSGFQKNDDG
jgi:hypothetical protein